MIECANILLHHTHFRRSIGFIADTIQSAKYVPMRTRMRVNFADAACRHGTAREYAYMYLLTILCSYPLHALERQMDTIEGLIIVRVLMPVTSGVATGPSVSLSPPADCIATLFQHIVYFLNVFNAFSAMACGRMVWATPPQRVASGRGRAFPLCKNAFRT